MFFSSCDKVVGDFLEFNQANRGSYVLQQAALGPGSVVSMSSFMECLSKVVRSRAEGEGVCIVNE